MAGRTRRTSSARSWRFVALTCVFLVVVPPVVAHAAATNFRYGHGYVSWESGFTYAQTPGYADRNYNRAYREGPCGYAGQWSVEYRRSPGTIYDITWRHESGCSPTSIGLTTGPRQALCFLESDVFAGPWAWNCDTTRP